LNIACLLRLHPARLVRGHQETSCWPPSMSYVAPVERRVADDVNG
jgi:hypothetical protein